MKDWTTSNPKVNASMPIDAAMEETPNPAKAFKKESTGIHKGEETLIEYQQKLTQAKLHGIDHIETTPEIISYWTKGKTLGKHLDGTPQCHFFDQNILVVPYGKYEETKQKIDMGQQSDQYKHGMTDAKKIT